MLSKIISHITQYLKHGIPQILQLACFIVSIGLFYGGQYNIEYILGVVFIALCSIIKIIRCIHSKHIKPMLAACMSFYFGFLLTAFQLLFYYYAAYDPDDNDDDDFQLDLSMAFIVVRNFAFSLVLDAKIASFGELFIYSLGELVILIINTLSTLYSLEFFDNGGCDGWDGCDFMKDCMLLSIATAIAISILVLDLFYRIFQQKKHLRKQAKQNNITEKEVFRWKNQKDIDQCCDFNDFTSYSLLLYIYF